MPISLLMPALSPTMSEGTLARWHKKEGDVIKAGQIIAEIETDKATMEFEAVEQGKLVKILIPGGTEKVAVNTPIAIMLEEGEEGMTAEQAMTALAAKKGAASSAQKSEPVKPAVEKVEMSAVAQSSGSSKIERVAASPLAKRLAELSGIDLKGLVGSGPGGRVVKTDVEHAQSFGRSSSGVASGVAAVAAVGMDALDYATKLGMAHKAIPNSGVRKVIAQRLTQAKQTVPHFYLTVDCEIDALLALRQGVLEATGAKVSVNDCVIRAVALALKKVPAANASWTDDAILQYSDVDISVAVATPNGLITPIIKKANTKSLVELSKEMKDLAARARDGKLKPEEFQGGGFSISNLGMYGIREFSAIINPPQSCILAVGAGEQRAVVKNGQLAVATVMTCTLSVDHRSVDGAVGAEFLAAFKPLIEKPYALVV
ncbi:MAG: pyruvate dehydrogenase complex dihydrolipoamide acetyltransferase [Bdellovibrionales bacterium]